MLTSTRRLLHQNDLWNSPGQYASQFAPVISTRQNSTTHDRLRWVVSEYCRRVSRAGRLRNACTSISNKRCATTSEWDWVLSVLQMPSTQTYNTSGTFVNHFNVVMCRCFVGFDAIDGKITLSLKSEVTSAQTVIARTYFCTIIPFVS